MTSFSLNEAIGHELLASSVGLYQQVVLSHLARCSGLINSQTIFTRLADKLIRLAEHFQASREANSLEEVSRVLMNLPIEGLQRIGWYYQAVAIKQQGQADEAVLLFETVVNNAPMAYRARAIQSLGFVYVEQGQIDEGLKLQIEALQAAPNDTTGLQAQLMAHIEISISKSIYGDHKGALDSLEKLAPMVRLVSQYNPFYFYSYRNSLAVELGELGRIEEGQATLAVALNSPYAASHPEWSETREELAAKGQSANPSQIAVSRSLHIEAEPKPRQHQQNHLQTTIKVRLSNSKEIILRVTRTATGQSHFGLFILDRLEETLQPRAPPSRFCA